MPSSRTSSRTSPPSLAADIHTWPSGLPYRLERSFESEKQFTADASHELRTPVSIITGACEYAERYDETGVMLSKGRNALFAIR